MRRRTVMSHGKLSIKEIDEYVEALIAFLPSQQQMDLISKLTPYIESDTYTLQLVKTKIEMAQIQEEMYRVESMKDAPMILATFLTNKLDEIKNDLTTLFQVKELSSFYCYARGEDDEMKKEEIYVDYDEDERILFVNLDKQMQIQVKVNHELMVPDDIFEENGRYCYQYEDIEDGAIIEILK